MRWTAPGVGAIALALLLSSCAAPRDDPEAYLGDSLSTVETVASYVATAELTASAVRDGRVPSTSANVVLSETVQSLSDTVSTYGLVEPPDERSPMRAQVLDVSRRAEDSVFSTLTAVRRGDTAALDASIDRLTAVDADLSSLATRLEDPSGRSGG